MESRVYGSGLRVLSSMLNRDTRVANIEQSKMVFWF